MEVTLASEGWSVLSEVIDFTVIDYESPQQGHVQGPGEISYLLTAWQHFMKATVFGYTAVTVNKEESVDRTGT